MSTEKANFTISDITVAHSTISKTELFKAWTWLLPEELEPILVTIFGDAF
ncbi:SMI1/KNR4 family protein [Oligella ureolytica]